MREGSQIPIWHNNCPAKDNYQLSGPNLGRQVSPEESSLEGEEEWAKVIEKEQPVSEWANQEKYLLSWKTVKKMFEERTSHATYRVR